MTCSRYIWGSYTPVDYGCDRVRQPDVANPYMWHHFEGGIELSHMMLRHWDHTGDQSVLQAYTLPWTDAVLEFYDEHYPSCANGVS